jgi:uncharacterized BrkB/YihY/UPF0761 family membrane protein
MVDREHSASSPSRVRTFIKSNRQHFFNFSLSIFLYLTILAGLMVLINFVQAALLHRLHSFAWIIVFPLAVFVLALVAICAAAFLSRDKLVHEWKEAKGM